MLLIVDLIAQEIVACHAPLICGLFPAISLGNFGTAFDCKQQREKGLRRSAISGGKSFTAGLQHRGQRRRRCRDAAACLQHGGQAHRHQAL